MEKKISKATMSRFPVYLKALRKMQHEGKETCLSSELFEITGIQDTTIRRDFTYLSKTDNFGRRGRCRDRRGREQLAQLRSDGTLRGGTLFPEGRAHPGNSANSEPLSQPPLYTPPSSGSGVSSPASSETIS